MGLVKKAPEAAAKAPEPEPEDPPIVKQLKVIDDKYMAIEKEYEEAVAKVRLEYQKLQMPILEERTKMLTEGDAKTGTPALSGFWLQAFKNHPELSENVQTWDEPILEYLTDVTRHYLDESDLQKGHKLVFHFAENPHFKNKTLEKEYVMGEENPFNGEKACKSTKATEIEWNTGKNVTVQMVAKKVKGGGAKKAKAKKEKEEPRESFFREIFRSLYPGAPFLQEMKMSMFGGGGMVEEDDDDDEDEQMLEYILEQDYEIYSTFADFVIPYATRWYTGEAVPEGFERDDDDEDDEDDEEEDDDEEDTEEDESESASKGKGAKAKPKGGAKKVSGDGGTQGMRAIDKKEEECKQQ